MDWIHNLLLYISQQFWPSNDKEKLNEQVVDEHNERTSCG